jgi:hypothetical protein
MSLDISVTVGDEEIDMNWLRNPFGLCNWAEANVQPKTRRSLWYVCNHWAYKKSGRVNKPLFLEVVLAYQDAIMALLRGYFVFDLPSYRSFIEPFMDYLPTQPHVMGDERRWIKDSKYDDHQRLMIPMEYFTHEVFHLARPSLAAYQEWFGRLVDLARLLQQPGAKFYCSN